MLTTDETWVQKMRLQSIGWAYIDAVICALKCTRDGQPASVWVCLDGTKCLLHVAFIGSFMSWWMLKVLSYIDTVAHTKHSIGTHTSERDTELARRTVGTEMHNTNTVCAIDRFSFIFCFLFFFCWEAKRHPARCGDGNCLSQTTDNVSARTHPKKIKLDTIRMTIECRVCALARDFSHLKQNGVAGRQAHARHGKNKHSAQWIDIQKRNISFLLIATIKWNSMTTGCGCWLLLMVDAVVLQSPFFCHWIFMLLLFVCFNVSSLQRFACQ